MNSIKKLAKSFKGKNKAKSIAISIVILLEVIAILTVASYAWVETVSSIKITNKDDETTVDTYVFTRAMIGNKRGTIDLGKYFRQGGDMHLSPASSADGRTMYFPQKNTANATTYTSAYRKGTISDKNTVYLSATFKLKTDTNADFFFTNVPSFGTLGSDIRVSVTAYSEGADPETHYDSSSQTYVSNTKIYALSGSTTPVVNSTSGVTGATKVESFDDHRKKEGQSSTNKLFEVGAEETKIVTINIWLQGSSMSGNISTAINISNFGIVSDLTPRHVTLIPTPTWDVDNTNEYFYAWCWDSDKNEPDKLFGPFTRDANGHYSFDYNGTYQSTLFIRAKRNDLREDMSGCWNTTYLYNKTADTSIPKSPVDPTYVIQTINDGAYDDDISANKSTGEWIDPVRVDIAYTSDPADQSSTWGTISATTYIGTSTSTHVMEQTSSSIPEHSATVHGWSGKRLKLSASPKTGYAFVGWYTTPDGTGSPISTSADNNFNISTSAGLEVTYYAKFKETRKITLYKYLDGSPSTASIGTFSVADMSGNGVSSSVSKTVDKGSSVTLSATPETGYSVDGFYNVQSGGTKITPETQSGSTKSVSITADSANYEMYYYARFTSNEHDVTASVIGGSSGGGQVKAGSAAKGTTSTAEHVKFNTNVDLVAYPSAGYEFVGWYDNNSASGDALSTDATYSYKLETDSNVTVYAKFKVLNLYLTGYLNGTDVDTTDLSRKFSFSSGTGKYTLTYTFTGGDDQYVTIFDGTNAYHPGTANAGSGTAADTSLTDTTPAGITGNKWLVDAPNGAKATFTWDPSTKKLSWTIKYYVYFKNDCNFSNVYVVLLNSSYWDNTNGSGAYGYTMHQMTYDSTKQLYYYEIGSTKHSGYIAFCQDNQSGIGNFYNTKAVYRGDFNVKKPVYDAPTSMNETKNGTDYYNNGSWIQYN